MRSRLNGLGASVRSGLADIEQDTTAIDKIGTRTHAAEEGGAVGVIRLRIRTMAAGHGQSRSIVPVLNSFVVVVCFVRASSVRSFL